MKKILFVLLSLLFLTGCESTKTSDIVDDNSLSSAVHNMDELDSYKIEVVIITSDETEYRKTISIEGNHTAYTRPEGTEYLLTLNEIEYMLEYNPILNEYNVGAFKVVFNDFEQYRNYDFDEADFILEDDVYKAYDIDGYNYIEITVENSRITKIIRELFTTATSSFKMITIFTDYNSTTIDFPVYNEITPLDIEFLRWENNHIGFAGISEYGHLYISGLYTIVLDKGDKTIEIVKDGFLSSDTIYYFFPDTQTIKYNRYSDDSETISDFCIDSSFLSCEDYENLTNMYNLFNEITN